MAKRIIITKHHEESSESEAEIDIFHRHAHPTNIRSFVSTECCDFDWTWLDGVCVIAREGRWVDF